MISSNGSVESMVAKLLANGIWIANVWMQIRVGGIGIHIR